MKKLWIIGDGLGLSVVTRGSADWRLCCILGLTWGRYFEHERREPSSALPDLLENKEVGLMLAGERACRVFDLEYEPLKRGYIVPETALRRAQGMGPDDFAHPYVIVPSATSSRDWDGKTTRCPDRRAEARIALDWVRRSLADRIAEREQTRALRAEAEVKRAAGDVEQLALDKLFKHPPYLVSAEDAARGASPEQRARVHVERVLGRMRGARHGR